jgi:hypothetical protein
MKAVDDSLPRRKGALSIRMLGWIAVASMLAVALIGPSAVGVFGLTAAVYTSNADGSVVNANIYAAKADVYLTGGPCPNGGDLPDGDYYFEVLQPAGGGELLSSDAIGERKFTIEDGFIRSASGHVTHTLICDATGITVQLLPYGDSSNGTYKLQIATASSVEACAGFNAASTTFQFCQQADQKSDNFRVGVEAPSNSPSNPPSVPASEPASNPPSVPASNPPSGGVEGTSTPGITPPSTSTDIGSNGSGSNGWLIPILGIALLLSSLLLLTPSRTVRRRR